MNISKPTIIYFSLIGVLLSYIGYIILRILPIDYGHVVYVCQSASVNIPQILLSLVQIFIVLILIRIIFIQFKTALFIHQLKKTQSPPKLNNILNIYKLTNKVVVFKQQKSAAFCVGIFTPKIYISTGLLTMMNEKELEAIILHEFYHLRYNDNLILLIFKIATLILFPFPIIKDLQHYFQISEEVNADQFAYRYLKDRAPIATALHKLIALGTPAQYGFAFTASEGLEYRISTLYNGRSQINITHRINIFISIFSLVFMSFLLFVPVTKAEIHTNSKNIVLFCFEAQSCANQCKTDAMSSRL